MVNLIQATKENILKHNLITRGDKVLVAYSGGPDSTAMLHILHRLSRRLKFSLAACYINHNIRPRAVRKEIKLCGEFCSKMKIPFFAFKIDIPLLAKEFKLSIEEAGHRFRKQMLEKVAKEKDCTRIATAHHLDDIVETILFRLFRGTGPQGLDPIKPVYGNFIRPLYNLSRQDIELYITGNNLPCALDRSNLESKYSRNYIRNKIIPVIEKHFGPKYQRSIISFAGIVTDENSFLAELTRKELRKIATVTVGGKIVIDLKRIASYDRWLRRRMIKQALEYISGHTGTGSSEDIERIDKLICGQLKTVSIGGNIMIARDRNRFLLFDERINIKEKEFNINKDTEIPEIKCRVRCTLIPRNKAVTRLQKAGNRVNIDQNKICPPMRIRGIKPGDSFVPLGMTGKKKVGDFLTDRKVSRFVRDEIPIISDKSGIIWLTGYQISDRVKINQTTKKVLEIEIIRKKGFRKAEI